MKEFTASIPFILAFLVALLFFSMMFGEKPTLVFLAVVALGMVYANWDETKKLIERVSTV